MIYNILHSVPDPPTGVSFLVFGTADVQVSWTMPNPAATSVIMLVESMWKLSGC